jgi:hypothetical protein
VTTLEAKSADIATKQKQLAAENLSLKSQVENLYKIPVYAGDS